MFDRLKYKQFARIQLKNRWTVPVLTTLFVSIIMLLLQIPEAKGVWDSDALSNVINSADPWKAYWTFMASYKEPDYLRWVNIITSLISVILFTAQIHVYLKMSQGPEPVTFGDFIEGLANWWRAIIAGIWTFLWTFLWTLLFIIPGIVKSIAYSQIFYLITEYPGLSAGQAMRISTTITRGYKGNLFAMYLSFIGWGLLCCCTCGIGFLWLIPYINMSLTNAYHGLLKQAFESHSISPEDFTK